MSMMINSYRFGAGPPPTGVYSRYRIDVTASVVGADHLGAGEIYFRDPGGNDLAVTASHGGTASADTTFGGYPASDAMRFLYNNYGWLNTGAVSGWLKYQSPSPIDVREVLMMARYTEPDRCPKDFTIEYSDDDSSWTVAATFTGQTGWINNVLRRYAVPSSGSHTYWRINVSSNVTGSYLGIGNFILVCDDNETISLTAIKGWPSAQTQFSGSYTIDGAFSRGTGAYYVASGTTGWIDFDFGAPVELGFLGWTPHTAEAYRSPKDFTLSGWDEGSASWVVLMTVTGASGWVAGTENVFAI